MYMDGTRLFYNLYTTMDSLLKHKLFLELLRTCKPAQQQALLATATSEQIHCLCNCLQNCLRKRYVLPQKVIEKIRPYERHVNKAADRKEV